jgi:hypothetical protein
LVCFGFDWLFCILVASTVWQLVKAVIRLKESIIVEDEFVKINGKAVPYGNITYVRTSQKVRIIIKTNDRKSYKLTFVNAQAVCNAIIANKTRIDSV